MTYQYFKASKMFLDAQIDKQKHKCGIVAASWTLTCLMILYLVGIHLIKIKYICQIYLKKGDWGLSEYWNQIEAIVFQLCNYVAFLMGMQLLYVYYNLGTQIQAPCEELLDEEDDFDHFAQTIRSTGVMIQSSRGTSIFKSIKDQKAKSDTIRSSKMSRKNLN